MRFLDADVGDVPAVVGRLEHDPFDDVRRMPASKAHCANPTGGRVRHEVAADQAAVVAETRCNVVVAIEQKTGILESTCGQNEMLGADVE